MCSIECHSCYFCALEQHSTCFITVRVFDFSNVTSTTVRDSAIGSVHPIMIFQSMQIKVYVSELVPVATQCASLVTSDGKDLVWVVTVRYLGVFVTRSKHISCSFEIVLPMFLYSVFGKIGRLASEEVVLHLIKSKCMSVLLYASESQSSRFTGISFHKNFNENFQNKIQRNCH